MLNFLDMDKLIIKDFAVKYWKYAVIVILSLMLFSKCNQSNGLIQTAKENKQKAKEYLIQARAIRKNLSNEITVYKSEIKRLSLVNKIKEDKLSNLSKSTKSKTAGIRHYNSLDISNYFITRYNAKKYVISSQNGTILKDTISKKVITDLIIGDGAKSEVKILREIVVVEKQKFEMANKMVDSLYLGLEAVSKSYENANIEKDKAIKNTEKAFRHERNKKNFWKLTTVATVLGGAYLLIK